MFKVIISHTNEKLKAKACLLIAVYCYFTVL